MRKWNAFKAVLFTSLILAATSCNAMTRSETFRTIKENEKKYTAGEALKLEDFYVYAPDGYMPEIVPYDNNAYTYMLSKGYTSLTFYSADYLYEILELEDKNISRNRFDNSFNSALCTWRGVDLYYGTKEEIKEKYGTGLEGRFDAEADYLCNISRINHPADAEWLEGKAYSWLLYRYKELAQIIFYFDFDNRICATIYMQRTSAASDNTVSSKS